MMVNCINHHARLTFKDKVFLTHDYLDSSVPHRRDILLFVSGKKSLEAYHLFWELLSQVMEFYVNRVGSFVLSLKFKIKLRQLLTAKLFDAENYRVGNKCILKLCQLTI